MLALPRAPLPSPAAAGARPAVRASQPAPRRSRWVARARAGTALLATVLLLTACLGPPIVSPELQPPADLIFVNGPVHTADDELGTVAAVAIVGDRIAWVGGPRMAEAWRGPLTRVIDLQGRALLPGFADAHLHLAGLANHLAELDLVGTGSYAEVVQLVVAEAATLPPGAWITGRGWDQNDWPEPLFPHHEPLSRAVPDHPVVLRRIDGHALLANAAALAAAGIGPDVAEPPGGRILRDEQGLPTGVFVDAAMALVTAAVPPVPPEVLADRLKDAIVHLHRRGVTAVHDAGVSAEVLAVLEQLDRDGALPLRCHVMVAWSEPRLRLGRAVTGWPSDDLTGNGRLAVRAVKLVADGALGSRGAALLAPYADEPDHEGLLLASPDELLEAARWCLAHGWQLATHAIGDRANRLVLDAYEQAFSEFPAQAADARFRIEHAQVLAPEDAARFAALSVVPSMQAQHCTSDMPWVVARLGDERAAGTYAWRWLLDAGCRIPGGSDAPVEQVAPLAALAAAVSRKDASGQPPSGFHAEQAMTREEALAHLTAWPAWAAFREDELGSLTPGKKADLVVLSADPLEVPVSALPYVAVDLTVFEGEIVYRRGGRP